MVYPEECYGGKDWMMVWKAPDLAIGPWPDHTGWSPEGSRAGYCDDSLHGKSDEEVAGRLVVQAFYLVFDGIPVETVLREFAKLRVWREVKFELLTPGRSFALIPGRGHGVINENDDLY